MTDVDDDDSEFELNRVRVSLFFTLSVRGGELVW